MFDPKNSPFINNHAAVLQSIIQSAISDEEVANLNPHLNSLELK